MPPSKILRPADRHFEPVPRTRAAHKAVLVGREDGAPNFAERLFKLEPGGRIPAHRHPDIEHEQFVLAGQMILGLDDETRRVSAGDAVFIPAGTVHWYENRGDETVQFLCTVPITDEYTTEWLEELE